jgi:hypothetical protein
MFESMLLQIMDSCDRFLEDTDWLDKCLYWKCPLVSKKEYYLEWPLVDMCRHSNAPREDSTEFGKAVNCIAYTGFLPWYQMSLVEMVGFQIGDVQPGTYLIQNIANARKC